MKNVFELLVLIPALLSGIARADYPEATAHITLCR
jgi:hypothetical protein